MLLCLLEFLETLIETTNERCKIKFLMNRSTKTLSSVHKLAARAYKSQLGHEIWSLNATGCVLVGGSMQPKGNIVLARLASHNNKINARFLGSSLANLFEFECLVKILHLSMFEFSIFDQRTSPAHVERSCTYYFAFSVKSTPHWRAPQADVFCPESNPATFPLCSHAPFPFKTHARLRDLPQPENQLPRPSPLTSALVHT